MEKHRRIVKGQLSEIFGRKALFLDKFYLTVGLYRAAELTWNNEGEEALSDEDKKILQAYADGVNDYLDGVGMLKLNGKTDTLLPPEFLAVGLNQIDPWTPTDSIALLRFANLGFTRNWSQELLRKIIGEVDNGSLKDLVDEIAPVSASGFMD